MRCIRNDSLHLLLCKCFDLICKTLHAAVNVVDLFVHAEQGYSTADVLKRRALSQRAHDSLTRRQPRVLGRVPLPDACRSEHIHVHLYTLVQFGGDLLLGIE